MMKKWFLMISLMTARLWAVDPSVLDSLVHEAWLYSEIQLEQSVVEINDSTLHPERATPDGIWSTRYRTSWISGYFSGCLWYMYQKTEDDKWKTYAEKWTGDIESEKSNDRKHDIALEIFCSFGNGHLLTGNSHYKDVVLTAANTLSTRYNANVGCIRSWGDKNSTHSFRVIIDGMIVLEILMWAANNGGTSDLADVAIHHALTTKENHLRPDGSSYHVINYNMDGTVKEKYSQQGYATESCWSRGQAWGIHGYTTLYRYTQDTTFLNAALDMADYFIDHLPDDYVPYSDFNAPDIPNVEKDASAAALACSGLLELDQYVTSVKYREAAEEILHSLCRPDYLTKGTSYRSILKRCAHHYGDNSECGLIYGDYYFIEAMLRYLNLYDYSTTAIQSEPKSSIMPETIILHQNYPNPFNGETVISLQLSVYSFMQIHIYNGSGRMVKRLFSGNKNPGFHELTWDGKDHLGSDVSSGIYLYQIKTNNYTLFKKMVFLK